jgi:uncharacterized membrane protein YcaP (DUF421 family)
MDIVLRAAFVYLFIVLILRVSGRRTLAQMTTFDFVLVIIISECTQQAIMSDDKSLTSAVLAISTLIVCDVILTVIKRRSKLGEMLLDGYPMLIVEHGIFLTERLKSARLDKDDILESIRQSGLEAVEQVKFAVLESSGRISIIPYGEKGAQPAAGKR